MIRLIVSVALALSLLAGAASAQPQALQLPPPQPASPPEMAIPKPKHVPAAEPEPKASASAPQSAALDGVVGAAATAPAKPAVKHRSQRRKPVTNPEPLDPYADLPINVPAKEALALSAEWMHNDTAMVARGDDGGVVFTFGQTMPTVVCAPLRICDIELQPGEQVMEQPHIGDPVRWVVQPGITGAGAGRTTHVLVKPTEAGLDTNLFIPTNRRMYRLRLVSSESNYVSVVSFHYPQDEKAAWDMALAEVAAEESEVVADLPSLSVDTLDFDYGVTVKRGDPSWQPVRVFADGERTYIQLPSGTTHQDAPAVVAVSESGEEQLVNFRFRGGYVIVDRVIDRAALISGLDGDAERVLIEHGCARRSWFGRCKG